MLLAMPPDPVRLTRSDIVTLGQRGEPWAFLPVAAQALRVLERDPQFRALYAANFARLGLRTAAMEHIQALLELTNGEPTSQSEAEQLASAVERLADDRVPLDDQLAKLRANLTALAERGVGVGTGRAAENGIEDATRQYEAAASGWTVCRASDGNIVRRSPAGEWHGIVDARGNARAFVEQHLVCGSIYPEPVTVEGVNPTWVLIETHASRPRTAAGFEPTIRLVQVDAAELFAGFAIADLRALIADQRVEWFVGPDAGVALRDRLLDRPSEFRPGPYVPLTTLTAPAANPSVPEVLHAARVQADETTRTQCARVEAIYAPRDAAWWVARWSEIRAGTAAPMRVLLATSRFTTYVRHATRDLADAFESAGASVRVIEERSAHSVLSAGEYCEALAEHDPDLIVAANYPRWKLSSVVPENVPFVCWVQDAMPHMYEADAGRRVSPMELLVGTITSDMLARHGYPPEQCIAMPVAASERKFHRGAVCHRLRERFTCDVAYISNQSESPDRTHDRLMREASASTDVVRTLVALRPHIGRIAKHSDTEWGWTSLRSAILISEEEAGTTLDPITREHLVRHYGVIMLDRTLRHQTLHWAAEICRRRGWSLGIFGAGWDGTAAFAPYARGHLDHGEEARSAYACAGVHLHVSANTIVHQRVMECALAGGLAISRLTADTLAGVRQHAAFIARDLDRPIRRQARSESGCSWASHPTLMQAATQLQKCGFAIDEGCWLRDGKWEGLGAHAERAIGLRFHAGWLMGDLAETTFTDAATLEARIERALTRPEGRDNVSRGVSGRVCTSLTHDSMVDTIMITMAERLHTAAKAASSQSANIVAA